MTVCGEKVTGVCVIGKCQHIKRCCPVVWDKYGKIKPKTNEEWLRQCTTEQLAEFLTKVILDDKRFRMTMVGGVNETKLWLKQPHQSVTNCND